MGEVSARFAEALQQGDLDALMAVPKAERHTHLVLNGNPKFIFRRTGVWIAPLGHSLHSMEEMHRWVDRHVGQRFGDTEGERLLLEAGFEQAARDGIREMWCGEDVWACEARFGGEINALLDAIEEARRLHAPELKLHLQMGFSRRCDPEDLLRWAEPFFESGRFDCVDLYGDERTRPIEAFTPIFRRAKAQGMLLRAHVGEWGTAEDIVRAVEVLELDEVQHGIAAADSPAAMRFLAERRVRLNVCPTSNLMLGRVASLRAHPIRKLFDAGVPLSIGTDDVLVFGSTLSQEFLKLHACGLFDAGELDSLRQSAFFC